jgi:hypothetical protein
MGTVRPGDTRAGRLRVQGRDGKLVPDQVDPLHALSRIEADAGMRE